MKLRKLSGAWTWNDPDEKKAVRLEAFVSGFFWPHSEEESGSGDFKLLSADCITPTLWSLIFLSDSNI